MKANNPGTALDCASFADVAINLSACERRAASLLSRRSVKKGASSCLAAQGANLHRLDYARGRRYRAARASAGAQGA